MNGQILELEIDATSLEGNPLRDPSRRTAVVYVPPGGAAGRPAVYVLHGFTGSARGWLNASPFTPTLPERIDALIAEGKIPPVVGVFPDGWTALGGTQWIDAPAVGRYQSYVAEDVVPAVEARLGTVARREARALAGKSSGGYGALAMARDRPEVFAHVACHSGDAYFEYCYLGDVPKAAAALLGTGGDAAKWLEDMRRRGRETKLDSSDHPVLNLLAMAAHYGPDPGAPLGFALPFELPSGRIREDVWTRWLAHDPVRFVPGALPAFRSLETVFLDCGTKDEFHLRWGARMVADALRAGGVAVIHEEFEDGHMGVNYRFEASLRVLAPRLAAAAGAER